MHVDFEQLHALNHDPAAYGLLLSKTLFADPAVWTAFTEARAAARALSTPLRLRLHVSPHTPELQALNWETLRDPGDGSVFLTNADVLFSRYVISPEYRPVRPRPAGKLRALGVVSNPNDLSRYQPGGRTLAPLDVPGELQRAREWLVGLDVMELGSGAPATLEELTAHFREGADILYLACHGVVLDGEPRLLLTDAYGRASVVAEGDVAEILGRLRELPRLVVFATPEGAGVARVLGPRLAEAGVPAVVVLEGNVTQETASRFMPVFFRELFRDPQIDRAMAAARAAVRDRPDWWAPVLFLRLRQGRLWYTPGPTADRPLFDGWDTLIHNVRQGKCIPILGPGLIEDLVGSQQEIARRWAETYKFPLAPHQREDLPQVAQYLAVSQGRGFLLEEMIRFFRREVLHRHGRDLPPELQDAPLERLMVAVGARRRERDPADPYRVLAEMPCPVYISTNPDNFLAEALTAAGKQPHVALINWRGYEPSTSPFGDEPDYEPDAHRPLVYHLFGHLALPDSLVLTEDDYAEFSLATPRYSRAMLPVVQRALADSGLLFLGFRPEEKPFQAVARSARTAEGAALKGKYLHVLQTPDPDESRTLDPDQARRYLELYLQGMDLRIYWGSVEDFARELRQHWRAAEAASGGGKEGRSEAEAERLVANGINGATGEYLLPPLTPAEIAALARGWALDPEQRAELSQRWLREQEPSY
jgi:hypothetical protein